MPVTYQQQIRRPYFPGHRSSYLELIPEEEIEAFARLDDIDAIPKKQPHTSMTGELDQMAAAKEEELKTPAGGLQPPGEANDYLSAGGGSYSGMSTPGTPGLTRTNSNGSDGGYSSFDTFGGGDYPPVDRLTMFDILENLALPQRLEKMQNVVHENAEKLRRQRQRLATRAMSSKNVVVDEWRKRVPIAPDEQLQKYRKRMRTSVDRLNKRWNDAKTVSLMEKVSFVTAVLNIFISAYLMGAFPEYFHYWYTVQLIYFVPLRWFNYHKIGFHYFLADLCYFVNMLLISSIWFFPQSKRLLISTYCLAFGNNAIAIVMWRNSLVFHSLDKTTTLFIHIMPCATLHVLIHLIPKQMQLDRFPAIHTIKFSAPGAPEHYSLGDMIIWATLPYAVWQLSYHFMITVRKRSKIAAGRPTSFTWLRRSYRGNFLGKFVLGFPDRLQEPIFMCIQYCYALLTMLPCPIWFWYRWASAGFLITCLSWASWNGATFYIDVFGRRMEKELNKLKEEVAKMSKSPELNGQSGLSDIGSPMTSPTGPTGASPTEAATTTLDLGPAAQQSEVSQDGLHQRGKSIDAIPALDAATPGSELKQTVEVLSAPPLVEKTNGQKKDE
ncbi:unnamed protein product [Zymoseptoria tritici ST99CH_3D1]|uniref:Glycerophosphocholine acyltransferase 1 n=2 Tax=Zymoseptoria tritici TaxID=1047171 RepID=A0A2H1GBL2_ZYMTR|nr:unnamed protein product [Zymoseptoria tritici ST99CH_1E4]SMR51875.1 unnamed protein product [Zymoseptoria tritici ST99CH_3D1]